MQSVDELVKTADAQKTKNQGVFNSFVELQAVLSKSRNGKKVIHCHGVFDLLHIGHIRHFTRAKEMGDILVVSVTPDRFVNKGPGRPAFPEQLRAEAIASMDCVDHVIINEWPTAVEAIEKIQPDFFVKGNEFQNTDTDITGQVGEEKTAVEAAGGQIAFTEDITFSSSNLLNDYFPSFSDEVVAYLKRFKERYSIDGILQYLDQAEQLKVLVLGEAIIDEYCYCEAMAKSGKEPVLATRFLKTEHYAGGILSVANHIASFCKDVTCMTFFGEKGEHEDFAKATLKDNVTLVSHYKDQSPTLVKRRYVEAYLKQKMFEIYEMNDEPVIGETKQKFIEQLEKTVADYDLVVIADYGHGILDQAAIATLSKKAKFLAVNTQANAGNQGFNMITKYPKADFVSIARRELSLALGSRAGVVSGIKALSELGQYQSIHVTCGSEGSLTYQLGKDIANAPALANKVVDRVGAGDAVLAVTSLYAALGAPADLLAFIGNVVGAEAVTIMGHERFIEKVPLMRHITHLLK